MSEESVFRFVSVRPIEGFKEGDRSQRVTRVYDGVADDTPLQKAIKDAAGEGPAAIRKVAEAYKQTELYVSDLATLPLDPTPGIAWALRNDDKNPGAIDVDAAMTSMYGVITSKLIRSPEFAESISRVADSLLAESLVPEGGAEARDRLVIALKFLTFLVQFVDDPTFPGQTLADVIGRRVVLVPRPPEAEPPGDRPDRPEPAGPAPNKDDAEVRGRLARLEQAHRELSDAVTRPDAISVDTREDREGIDTRRLAELDRRIDAAVVERVGKKARRIEPVLGDPRIEIGGQRLLLSERVINRLSGPTKDTLRSLRIATDVIEPLATIATIEREIADVGGTLVSPSNVSTVLAFGGVTIDADSLRLSIGGPGPSPGPVFLTEPCEFAVGVGDLLIVRQDLKAYELAEFAHVENVLEGESRLREHRRLTVREEIEISEEERETEKERDLQSTERNEMQAEAEKTVKSQFQLDAGLQVSGSYGPSVSFSASLNAGFSTATEETQRKAVSYSREVTEKTSERVRERVRSEIRRRTLEEIQEINRHGIDNPAGNGHIRGIYRWLNKVYDAQIFNYGQRMMYEFTVPEPAAYFLYAMVEHPPVDAELKKPEPPTYWGQPLKPSHLSRGNYLGYVADYQVRNVQAPPPEFQHIAFFDRQDKVDQGTDFGRAGKVEVPTGYYAYGATVASDYIFTKDKDNHLRVMLGNRNFDRTPYWGSEYKDLSWRYRELSIAISGFNIWSFAVGIDVYCRLTGEGLAKWQQQVYDSIIEAYLVLKADYDEKMAARAIQQGIPVLGRNPLENRRIERDELKKLVIMFLTNTNDVAKDSFWNGGEPTIWFDQACANGSWIRFFENAFEWHNMTYALYPYFWGRHARWITAMHLEDPDPDFGAFLKAGAARVQVPVRPGFEQAMAHFCQFGDIWDGNDPPLIDDDLYVPIVDEISEHLGKLDDGVPYPPGSGPWEVRIPTSLVLVQNLDEIPGIIDTLTGNQVVIDA